MQASFSDLEYDVKKGLTRRDRFLAKIETVSPSTFLVAELEPFYPKGEGRGCPPIALEKMLRMYLSQQCFGFSDEAIEDALYYSQAIRRLAVWISDAIAPEIRRCTSPKKVTRGTLG